MVKCFEDEDWWIVDLVCMFFIEFSIKDNVVYNYFVDMFSFFSVGGKMDEESFKWIVKFLFGFVEKVSIISIMYWFDVYINEIRILIFKIG